MTIYLVRHAQPLVEGGICYGASDVACDPQVLQTAAAQLLRELPKGLPIISSPLQRCEQLALYLRGLEPTLTFQTDTALAEMHFGHWEMQHWDAIAPQELAAWTDDFANYRCGGSGESTAQFVQRVAARLARSVRAERDEIWITHAGVIRALQWLQQQSGFLQWIQAISWGQQGAAQELPLALPPDLLCQLRAADWPRGVVAYCQVQTMDWK
jgi:alpha-ribazole phosphatase